VHQVLPQAPNIQRRIAAPHSRIAKKRVRIVKKVRVGSGVWKFITLDRIGGRYVWEKGPGPYFLERWEGRKRRHELAGETPSQVLEAQRRKTNELIGEMFTGATHLKPPEEGGTATPIIKALELFTEHVKTHSPAKPSTHQRYHQVLAHFERILGKKKYMEAITRSDMDDYKVIRSRELFGERPVSPATINFEITILRALFYYLIRERGISMDNPCARFKPLRSEKERLKGRPPVYMLGSPVSANVAGWSTGRSLSFPRPWALDVWIRCRQPIFSQQTSWRSMPSRAAGNSQEASPISSILVLLRAGIPHPPAAGCLGERSRCSQPSQRLPSNLWQEGRTPPRLS
jgi:hypothetical protein